MRESDDGECQMQAWGGQALFSVEQILERTRDYWDLYLQNSGTGAIGPSIHHRPPNSPR